MRVELYRTSASEPSSSSTPITRLSFRTAALGSCARLPSRHCTLPVDPPLWSSMWMCSAPASCRDNAVGVKRSRPRPHLRVSDLARQPARRHGCVEVYFVHPSSTPPPLNVEAGRNCHQPSEASSHQPSARLPKQPPTPRVLPTSLPFATAAVPKVAPLTTFESTKRR